MTSVAVDHLFPEMDASSAVLPTARVMNDSLVVAYHLPGCESSAVVRFKNVASWSYGYPNDEGLHEHPLYGAGLTCYEFHQVQDADKCTRTWIATFHDGTLTVEAGAVEVLRNTILGEPWTAIDTIVGPGRNRYLDDPHSPVPPHWGRIDDRAASIFRVGLMGIGARAACPYERPEV